MSLIQSLHAPAVTYSHDINNSLRVIKKSLPKIMGMVALNEADLCFANREELKSAVDQYIIQDECATNKTCQEVVAQRAWMVNELVVRGKSHRHEQIICE